MCTSGSFESVCYVVVIAAPQDNKTLLKVEIIKITEKASFSSCTCFIVSVLHLSSILCLSHSPPVSLAPRPQVQSRSPKVHMQDFGLIRLIAKHIENHLWCLLTWLWSASPRGDLRRTARSEVIRFEFSLCCGGGWVANSLEQWTLTANKALHLSAVFYLFFLAVSEKEPEQEVLLILFFFPAV